MIDRSKLSPMMQHYLKMKDEYEGCILFYRLGDFYEMFFDDAELVSRELELTLTGKDCGLEERAPMCGIPYHAADTYISRLIKLGHRVAICEQVQDPKEAKGLVERKVIRIVTPGTSMTGDTLSDEKNNYIMSVYGADNSFGIAVADISTGSFLTTEVKEESKIIDEIIRFEPSEIIIKLMDKPSHRFTDALTDLKNRQGITESPAVDSYYHSDTCAEKILKQMKVSHLEGLGLKDYPAAVMASGALLQYLLDTQMDLLDQINHIELYFISEILNLQRLCVIRRNVVLLSGFWIRLRLPWVPDFLSLTWICRF